MLIIKMSVYKCSNCDYTSTTKGLTKKHTETMKCKGAHVIDNIIKVECEVCAKQFDTEKLLSIHKKKCFEKKAVMIEAFIDPSTIEKTMKDIMSTMCKMNEKIANLEAEGETIKKELEKLKSKNKEEEQEVKEVDKEEGNNCSFFKEIKIIPVSRQQVKNILEEAKCEDDHVDVTIEGQRSIIVEADISEQEYIEVGTQKYYYKKRGKNDLCASKLKIIFKKYCGAAADCEINGCYYCGEHVNQV